MFIEGKQVINCPPTKDIISRAAQLWGHTFSENLINIETEKPEARLHITGTITNHQYFRYDRNKIFFFVNKRWIKNYQLSQALLKGYMNVLPPAKYPAAFIFVEIDPIQVDINIHPRKEEVKFLHPRTVAMLLQSTVKTALEHNLSNQLKKTVTISTQNQQQSVPKTFKPIDFDQFLKNNVQKSDFSAPTPEIKIPEKPKIHTPPMAPKPIKIETQAQIEQKKYEIVGQFKKTYIILEKDDGLFFVDQHAAHERILYELFSKRFEDVATVQLLFPQIISLKEPAIQLIEKNLDIFKKNGIEIELFGQNQLIVKATPVHIKNIKIDELVRQVVAWIEECQNLDPDEFFKAINERMHAQMACKAAVKAGDALTVEQMAKLLSDLEQIENRLTCPHGRPTGWTLYTHEIEKKFKRRP